MRKIVSFICCTAIILCIASSCAELSMLTGSSSVQRDNTPVNEPTVPTYDDRYYEYSKDNWDVFYRGRKVEGASASSFTDLGGGYGKDTWKVFYRGREVNGASSSSFQYLGKGYAKDTWKVYHEGHELKGASSSSFQVPNR